MRPLRSSERHSHHCACVAGLRLSVAGCACAVGQSQSGVETENDLLKLSHITVRSGMCAEEARLLIGTYTWRGERAGKGAKSAPSLGLLEVVVHLDGDAVVGVVRGRHRNVVVESGKTRPAHRGAQLQLADS